MDPKNEILEDDEFSRVFDSLMEKGAADETDTPADSADGAGLPAGDAEQPGEQADGEGRAGEPAAAGADTPAADAQGEPDRSGGQPAGGDAGDQGVDWEARFRALEARIAAQPAAAEAAHAAIAAPAPAPEPVTPADIYSPAEREELTALREEWPDAARMFELLARQVQVDTLNYAFSELSKVISPIQDTVQQYTTNDHMAAIYEAHDDYDAVYQPVMEWIEKQPSFLKTAYHNVVKEGTAEDVITMIQRFKDEVKWAAPPASAPAASSAAPATPPEAGLSEAAMKAAKALGAVGAKRGAPPSAQDPNDFDAAWEEAVSRK